MAKPLVPRALLDPVIAHFKPQRVILFGSRARGDFNRDSDIDLLVILDDAAPPENLSPKRGSQLGPYRGAADVFPMLAAAFERNRNVVGTMAAEADADGIVVYGSPKEPPLVKNVDPRARWEAVQRWLDTAGRDRRAAEALLALDPPDAGNVAFHCQQAVEKLLKGFLVLAAKRARKTHSLDQLGAMAIADFPQIAALVGEAEGWTSWAFAWRYPSTNAPAEPDEAEFRRALEVIDNLSVQLRAANPEPRG